MKILIAEDERSFRELMRAALEAFGHTCLEARDGQEAVDLALLEEPDLILIDLKMPVVNGWEAVRAIRRIPRLVNIPIICISGICTGEIQDLTMEKGVNDCLQKPFGIEKLLEKIKAFDFIPA